MNTRKKAWELLNKICIGKSYSTLLLRHELDNFTSQDKALITNIVYGTLQNYRLTRYMWEGDVKNLPTEPICILLDMSAYQMFFMDKLPAYAILNDAVEIAKHVDNGRYAKLVNALLRNLQRNGRRIITETGIEKIAIVTSHPTWLLNMWLKQYGKDTMIAIVKENNEKSTQCGRVNTLQITLEEFLNKYPMFTLAKSNQDKSNSAVYYESGNIADSEAYKIGDVSIQDESSQMVANFMAPKPNDKILDACSAPGSKAAHMATIMNNQGEIIAMDIHEHRVELIKEGMERQNIKCVKAIVGDATQIDERYKEYFDKVLVDAPCSGYGVLRRKADIKYHMKSEDMDSISKLQADILQVASKTLKKQGILVYSTCTLNKKENEKQIAKFLNANEDFKLIEEHTIFPYEYHSDGFYMAKLIKE
ncbi:MAG: 16S rRNA (cytosine(967)-C(5))-methyltransferase RsmB [Erysipelotrichaceae bacterium]